MAIARDTTATINLTGTTALNTTYTCSGVNRILFLMTMSGSTWWTGDFAYGGVAMTQIASGVIANNRITLWYLINPASGSNSITGSWGGNEGHGVILSSYTGVGGINVSSSTTGSGTSFTMSGTTTKDNCWGIYAGATGGVGAITAGTNSSLISRFASVTEGLFDTNAAQTPAGSKSMQFTGDNASKAGVIAFFYPVFTITASDTQSSTDTATLKRTWFAVATDILTILEVQYLRATDTVTTDDLYVRIKKGWNNLSKHISSWTDQNKN